MSNSGSGEDELPRPRQRGQSDESSEDLVGRRILIVDDEPLLRMWLRHVLERERASVYEAGGQDAAERAWQSHARPLDLLVVDVFLPDGSGPVLARRVCAVDPQTRVLYMSAHSAQNLIPAGFAEPSAHLLCKPFSAETFLDAVKKTCAAPTR